MANEFLEGGSQEKYCGIGSSDTGSWLPMRRVCRCIDQNANRIEFFLVIFQYYGENGCHEVSLHWMEDAHHERDAVFDSLCGVPLARKDCHLILVTKCILKSLLNVVLGFPDCMPALP
ncbi:MAG: hypothetical protein A2792_17070 [Sphingomonadales bacterium RIFCSPHIGHO2_01_FULL_65_20]|nr:MAG: hypothetical protein A2792_17070 [Sphingomonadales bacterium RIFCSPHIGHO2_01_FULL_65_20]